MRIFLLVTLTMTAFAANSVLNRVAVAQFGMDPMVFAVLRVGAGAAMLWLLVARRGVRVPVWRVSRIWGAVSLAVYMIGFSWAYLSLGAGLGALILFGVIQMVMFGWAVKTGVPVAPMRWGGAGVALAGLVVLLWPTGAAVVAPGGAFAMVTAGVGWAVYTLLGRGSADALGDTAANFLVCFPAVAVVLLFGWSGAFTLPGVTLAVIAGAVTSGLGYALWYRVLPGLPVTLAAIAQLSVPVIAVVAGAVLLGEAVSLRVVIAGMLVLGGIAISVLRS